MVFQLKCGIFLSRNLNLNYPMTTTLDCMKIFKILMIKHPKFGSNYLIQGDKGDFWSKASSGKCAAVLKFMFKLLSSTKLKRHLSFCKLRIKSRIPQKRMLYTSFHALDAVTRIQAKLNALQKRDFPNMPTLTLTKLAPSHITYSTVLTHITQPTLIHFLTQTAQNNFPTECNVLLHLFTPIRKFYTLVNIIILTSY